MDLVETGRTDLHVRGPGGASWTIPATFFCQCEGRGFESRLPLQKVLSDQGRIRLCQRPALESCPSLPISCPSRMRPWVRGRQGTHVKGSIRQRGSGSFELRVYVGTDPDTGKRRWITRTVRGTRADAQRELRVLAAHANVAPAVGAHTTVAELLDQWFARGRTGWSPTTVRNLGSIVERHLRPARNRRFVASPRISGLTSAEGGESGSALKAISTYFYPFKICLFSGILGFQNPVTRNFY